MNCPVSLSCFFFFNDPPTTEIYTLSLHDALPISGPQHGRADEQQQDALSRPVHSSTAPTATAPSTATANVAGANRSANRRPKVPACMANSFRSIIGPTTMNASFAVSENCDSEAATNASASEQIDRITARTASTSTDTTGSAATACSQPAGTTAFRVAAAIAPTTRKPPAWTTSWRTEPQKAPHRPSPSNEGRGGGRSQSGRPS